MVAAQENTKERSHVCVSQQYCWKIIIELEWEDMRMTNSTHDIFIRYYHHFQLNLDETCLLCNEGELRIIGGNNKTRHKKFQLFKVFN